MCLYKSLMTAAITSKLREVYVISFYKIHRDDKKLHGVIDIESYELWKNRTAHKMMIPDHYKTDAHCDTERDKQCV